MRAPLSGKHNADSDAGRGAAHGMTRHTEFTLVPQDPDADDAAMWSPGPRLSWPVVALDGLGARLTLRVERTFRRRLPHHRLGFVDGQIGQRGRRSRAA